VSYGFLIVVMWSVHVLFCRSLWLASAAKMATGAKINRNENVELMKEKIMKENNVEAA